MKNGRDTEDKKSGDGGIDFSDSGISRKTITRESRDKPKRRLRDIGPSLGRGADYPPQKKNVGVPGIDADHRVGKTFVADIAVLMRGSGPQKMIAP